MSESLIAPARTSLLTNRACRLLWIKQAVSLAGDYFLAATIAIWTIDKLAHGTTWLPLATGAVALTAALPSLLVGPFVGV